MLVSSHPTVTASPLCKVSVYLPGKESRKLDKYSVAGGESKLFPVFRLYYGQCNIKQTSTMQKPGNPMFNLKLLVLSEASRIDKVYTCLLNAAGIVVC